jgi:mannose-6-phosphate isomerase-like protein (cupin superfamily)
MRNVLLLSLLAAALASAGSERAAAQAQPAPAPRTQQPPPAPKPAPPTTTAPKPAPAAPAPGGQATTPTPRRPAAAAPAATRGGMAITVTDPSGATIPGVKIASDGPTPRNGETNASGQANFPALLAGVYRLRFEGDAIVAFEKEVSIRNGQVLAVDVMLNPAKKVAPPPAPVLNPAKKVAPPPAPAPVAAAPPPAVAAPVGPPGQLQVLSLVDLAEKELERKQPRRETLVSCSANTRSTLLQLNQDQPQRLYENAESLLYVIAGEGALRVNDKETRMVAGSFAAIPRDTPFVVARRGRNPVIFLSVLSGEPCDAPK